MSSPSFPNSGVSQGDAKDTSPAALPKPWLQGAERPEDAPAAELLRSAFGGPEALPHPEVKERMRLTIEARLSPRPRSTHQASWSVWGRPGEARAAFPIFASGVAAAAVVLALGLVVVRVVAYWSEPHHQRARATGTKVLNGEVAAVTDEFLLLDPATTHHAELAPQDIAANAPVQCQSPSCLLDIHGRARATLEQHAVISVQNARHTELRRGRVFFAVQHLSLGDGFAVETHDALVEVVGTAFLVDTSPGRPTRVEVTEGTVRITPRDGGAPRYVRATEAWQSTEPSQTNVHLREEAAFPEDNEVIVSPSPSAPEGEATSAQTPSSEEETQPAQSRRSSPGAKQSPPHTSAPKAAAVAPRAAENGALDSFDDPSALLRRANALADAGALDRAAELYRELAAAPGPSGELGLYYLAQFELRRLHTPGRARETLATMAARYPGGSLRVERSLTEIETWLAEGNCPRAISAIELFEQRFAGSRSMVLELMPMLEAQSCER